MQGEIRKQWMELCERIADQQDSEKLVELTRTLTRLLQENEARLKARSAKEKSP